MPSIRDTLENYYTAVALAEKNLNEDALKCLEFDSPKQVESQPKPRRDDRQRARV